MKKISARLVKSGMKEELSQIKKSVALESIKDAGMMPGHMLGWIVEKRVYEALCNHTQFEIKYFKIKASKVYIGSITNSEYRGKGYGEDLPKRESNTCTHTPNMTKVDVIVKLVDKTYFIQVTVGDITDKKGFWDLKIPPDEKKAVFLLAAPDAENQLSIKCQSNSSQILKEYQEKKFGVLLLKSILDKKTMDMMRNIVPENDLMRTDFRRFSEIK
ncbi:hypothetical protein OS493_006915 [Desmophyllum pertusum]|uniref:Uncharacterized protein n=1 Tax=Desmophyllum pertusum TaxID=174260 RepID=A0A9W9ZS76_9CNID|nr:hypothetical protein OS493_006915 [Desmophyllum pertusum]